MAVLTGTIDCTVEPNAIITSLSGPADTFVAVSNNGPVIMHVKVSGFSTEPVVLGNTRLFYVPGGSTVEVEGPGSTGSWQYVVPG